MRRGARAHPARRGRPGVRRPAVVARRAGRRGASSSASRRCWSFDRDEILDAAWADNGPGWVAVLLEDGKRRARRAAGQSANLDLGIVGAYPPGSPEAFEVRAFFPKDGVLVEDPVTGSLNAAIAPWLLRTGRTTAPDVVSQGTLLGRAGRVHVEREDDGTIWVGGASVTCVSGEVEL